MIIDIAIGKKRNQKTWRNTKVNWLELVDRFRQTHRTHETYKEYLRMSKDQQSNVKDVGGFVGGYLIDGVRKPSNIKHRQLLTLDMDSAVSDIWDRYDMLMGYQGVMYSTHKHSTSAPRYRLVVLLSRPVNNEEYAAIARRVAYNLGMKNFDPTGFQPERLMYWPSTSKDGVYEFFHALGDPLPVDTVLSSYVDWRDISEWPLHESERDLFKHEGTQVDPTEKEGYIGAFCRKYTISEAIAEFLPNIYKPVSEDRYTYVGGTTASGVVIYQDKWSYSHHATDPAGGKLCNAFDLVRLHRYHRLDKEVSEDVVVSKLPSYTAMMDFVGGMKDIIRDVAHGFDDDFLAQNDAWLDQLEYDKKSKKLKPTIDNILCILKNDHQLKSKLSYNTFEHREYINGATPWKNDDEIRTMTDADDAGIRHYLESTYGIFHEKKTRDATELLLTINSFHPVRTYLNALVWDGIPRLDTVLIQGFGSEDSEYVRAVTRKWFTAAIARVYNPGCKFDYVLTLVGAQGLRKSMFFKHIGQAWYSNSLGNIQTKEAQEQIQGVWIMEIDELAGLKKAEIEVVKHFITKQEDNFRVAYGRRTTKFKRQCVFGGSTNEWAFLRDPTGGRRFWPVSVFSRCDLSSINADQLWAEAKMRYDSGEALYLPDMQEALAQEVQKMHGEADSWTGIVERYLDTPITATWDTMTVYERRAYLNETNTEERDSIYGVGTIRREVVCVAELWCELAGAQLSAMNNNNTKHFHAILSNMEGWERSKGVRKFALYGAQRAYVRKNSGAKAPDENSGDWW